jgi:phosphoribosylanthranilate isomerase
MNGKDADALSASFAEGRKAEREMHLQKTEELRTAVENIIQPVAVSYSKGQQAIEEILSTISALQSRLDEAVDELTAMCTCWLDIQQPTSEHDKLLKRQNMEVAYQHSMLTISKAKAVKG